MAARIDVLVVGAGFSGAVVAQRLADSGRSVVVIDKRSHIGGNAHDRPDAHGVLVHPYGPHIFHTNSDRIVGYLSQFTAWRPYEHRVLASVDGKLLPIPINVDTVNGLYGCRETMDTIEAFYERVREPRSPVLTSEDVILNKVGRDLYEKFFRGYTRKQWGLDPSQLSASVTARIPVRTNHDDRYFTDSFQCMPTDGYTTLFRSMLDHHNIAVELSTDYSAFQDRVKARHLVYTGPIDVFFDRCYGALPYRSIRFEHEHFPEMARYQPVATVNYPDDQAYTRITEFKHLTGQRHRGTSIVKEYAQDEGDPYYPVPRPQNEALFKRYEALTPALPDVTFVGRLAQYRYYNMDQCVGAALKAADAILEKFGAARTSRLRAGAKASA